MPNPAMTLGLFCLAIVGYRAMQSPVPGWKELLGARIPGMADALGNRMNVSTSIVNPFERIPVSPEAVLGMELDEAAPMLLLPLGLALRHT